MSGEKVIQALKQGYLYTQGRKVLVKSVRIAHISGNDNDTIYMFGVNKDQHTEVSLRESDFELIEQQKTFILMEIVEAYKNTCAISQMYLDRRIINRLMAFSNPKTQVFIAEAIAWVMDYRLVSKGKYIKENRV